MTLTRSEIEDIVEMTVTRTLDHIGIDASEAHELRQDFNHLRRSRRLFDKAGVTAVTVLVATVVSGVAAAVWSAVSRH